MSFLYTVYTIYTLVSDGSRISFLKGLWHDLLFFKSYLQFIDDLFCFSFFGRIFEKTIWSLFFITDFKRISSCIEFSITVNNPE